MNHNYLQGRYVSTHKLDQISKFHSLWVCSDKSEAERLSLFPSFSITAMSEHKHRKWGPVIACISDLFNKVVHSHLYKQYLAPKVNFE